MIPATTSPHAYAQGLGFTMPPPTITPNPAPAGQPVTFTGSTGGGGNPGDGMVLVLGTDLSATHDCVPDQQYANVGPTLLSTGQTYSFTTTITTPGFYCAFVQDRGPGGGIGTGTPIGTSNPTESFSVTASTIPSITPSISLSPNSGPAGTQVSISGSGFSLQDSSCTIASSIVTGYTCNMDNAGDVSGSLTVNAQPGTYNIQVIGSKGDSASPTFTVTPTVTTSCDLPSCFNWIQALFGGIVLLAAVLIVIGLLRRRKPTPTQTTKTKVTTGMVSCGKCGTQNPTANDFCRQCGADLN
jgi:hypothetical protein